MRFRHYLENLNIANVVASIQEYEQNECIAIEKYYRYLNGRHDIYDVHTSEGRPDMHVVANRCKKVIDNYFGFLNPQGIETEDQYLNDINSELSDSIKDALTTGVGYGWIYYDKALTYKRLYPTNTMVFRDTTLSHKVIGAATWNYYTIIENGSAQEYVDLYVVDESKIYYYKGKTLEGASFVRDWRHNIKGVPILEFRPTSHYDSLIDPVIPLQDLVNMSLTSYANNRQAFQDSFLMITGISITDDSARGLIDGDKKLLNLPLPDARAEYLTKPDSGADVVTVNNAITDNICELVNMPSLSDPRMGVSSGEALRAKTLAMCNSCNQYRKSFDETIATLAELTTNFTYEWPGYFDDLDSYENPEPEEEEDLLTEEGEDTSIDDILSQLDDILK